MAGLYEDDRESDAIPFFREGWAMREAVGACIHSWCKRRSSRRRTVLNCGDEKSVFRANTCTISPL